MKNAVSRRLPAFAKILAISSSGPSHSSLASACVRRQASPFFFSVLLLNFLKRNPKSMNYKIGSITDIDTIIENRSETKPPSLNHSPILVLIMTGTMAVLTNLASISFTAKDRLNAVLVSCFSLVVRYFTIILSRLLIIIMTKAQMKEITLISISLF